MKFDRVKFTGLRVTKNMSQKALAEALKVSRPTVAGWEDGTIEPRINQLDAAATALGVKAEDLIIKA